MSDNRPRMLGPELVIRRFAYLFGALVLLVIVGSVGFAAIEHVSLAYGLEWTLDTVTTLGSIPDPPDGAGRALKVVLEILGIGTLFYALATVAEFFVSGQLSGLLARRRTLRMIDSRSDHYIVCGFGRVGRQAVRDLAVERAPYVVVDDNPANRAPAVAAGIPYLDGSPSDDEVLRSAGIERARAVIACVDSDAENIFIALTARELRSEILIVARASAEDSEKKLLRAGADRVISPYKTSGTEMARIALHPQVSHAVSGGDYRMEEIEVTPSCDGAGRTIADVRGSSVVIAVRNRDGALETQPSAARVLSAGDHVFALGSPEAIAQLELTFQPTAVPVA